ncbi:MAG: GIY-YIG nuclease family protein [Bacilli bacterium]|jgi:hypothetical protein
MDILLNEIIAIKEQEYSNWTLCLNNANREGIYSFEENNIRLLEHISWKRNADSTRDFRTISTNYCLQFMRLDREGKYDQWLFLGAYENLGVIKHADGHETYDLKIIDRFRGYSERLIIEYKKIQGPKQAKIEIKNIENIKVVSVLEKKYINVNRKFNGYNNVTLPFKELKLIINSNVDNWRELLSNVNCVYSITDTTNGKIYIGSTYGFNGVWQRWSRYVETNGTGDNVELKKLIESNFDYADNFVFTILECFFNRDGNQKYIEDREIYWKKVFETRSYGNNRN